MLDHKITLIIFGVPEFLIAPNNRSSGVLSALLKILNYPLAAPSANISSRVSPVTKNHVKEEFGKKIKYIIRHCGKSNQNVICQNCLKTTRILK